MLSASQCSDISHLVWPAIFSLFRSMSKPELACQVCVAMSAFSWLTPPCHGLGDHSGIAQRCSGKFQCVGAHYHSFWSQACKGVPLTKSTGVCKIGKGGTYTLGSFYMAYTALVQNSVLCLHFKNKEFPPFFLSRLIYSQGLNYVKLKRLHQYKMGWGGQRIPSPSHFSFEMCCSHRHRVTFTGHCFSEFIVNHVLIHYHPLIMSPTLPFQKYT